MPVIEPPPTQAAAEAAITRVLTAERDALETIAQALRDAEAMNENARAAARALGERTERRIRAVRGAFAARVAAEVAAIDAQAAAQDAGQPLSADELDRLERAVAALAAELTGGMAMTREGDLDYAWARVCARLGERPDEVAWRSIELIRDLPALLDAARGPAFRRWLVGVTPDAGPHAIEASFLRAGARW